MSCLEIACTNPKCEWWDLTNDPISTCPKCGEGTVIFFDEPELEDLWEETLDWEEVDER